MTRRERWLVMDPLRCAREGEGRVVAGQEVDHVTTRWKGGEDEETNY